MELEQEGQHLTASVQSNIAKLLLESCAAKPRRTGQSIMISVVSPESRAGRQKRLGDAKRRAVQAGSLPAICAGLRARRRRRDLQTSLQPNNLLLLQHPDGSEIHAVTQKNQAPFITWSRSHRAPATSCSPQTQKPHLSCRSRWQAGGTSCTSSCAGRGCCGSSCNGDKTHTSRALEVWRTEVEAGSAEVRVQIRRILFKEPCMK